MSIGNIVAGFLMLPVAVLQVPLWVQFYAVRLGENPEEWPEFRGAYWDNVFLCWFISVVVFLFVYAIQNRKGLV